MTDVETDTTTRPPAEGSPDVPPQEPDTASPTTSSNHARVLQTGLGVVRLGVGAALVVAPGWAGRVWVGPGADGPGSKVFARALGARDVALGIQILRAVHAGQPVAHWITAGFVADAADVTAALIAARHLTAGRRVAMPVIAGAVGAAAVLTSRLERRG